MVISTASEAGELIGRKISEAQDYKQDFIPTEETSDINIVGLQTVNVVGSYFVYKQDVGTAFQVDHSINSKADDIYKYDSVNIGSRTLSSSGEL